MQFHSSYRCAETRERERQRQRQREMFIFIILWIDSSSSMLLYVHEVKRQTRKLDS